MTTARLQMLGTYRTPRFTYGSVVFCEVRGEVIIGLTSTRILGLPAASRQLSPVNISRKATVTWEGPSSGVDEGATRSAAVSGGVELFGVLSR